jgi:hypothetical protein
MINELPTEKLNRLFSLLSFVPMPKREKFMWVKLVKEMDETQLDKLINILAAQANKMTDISIKVLKKRTENKGL